jgi:hypothetical protein
VKEVEKLISCRPVRKFNFKNPIGTLKNKTVALKGLTQPFFYFHLWKQTK